MTNENQALQIKPPKSVKLTHRELSRLKAYREKFDTEVDCAISLGMDRVVLNRILAVGSGSLKSIEKIRAKV
jgi:hypothetical protein